MLLGGRHVHSSVMQRAMRHRVPIAFHKWDGKPVGLLLPDRVRSPSPISLRQWEWARDEGERLAVARALVAAKIRNVRLLVRRRRQDTARLRQELERLRRLAESCPTIARLRGLEGQAAHAYFACWNDWLRPALGRFPGRVTRGADDPVNAMLNLLYTQLFRLTHTTILSTGLDPYLGVLHEARGRYAALAADLMEPFRFLADRVLFELVNHGRVSPKDFQRREKGPYRLLLGKQAVSRLLEAWEQLLAREVESAAGECAGFRGQLYRQAMSLRRRVEGGREPFSPFRMKW